MNNLTYKLYHVPSGMYYCPSRTITNWATSKPDKVKSNFSDKGKRYKQYPALSILGEDDSNLFTHAPRAAMNTEVFTVKHSCWTYSEYKDREYQQPVIKVSYLDWAVDMFVYNDTKPTLRAFLHIREV